VKDAVLRLARNSGFHLSAFIFDLLPPSQGADAAAPIIEEQLAKAGVRLAMALNRLWP
jgi:hypothetical protein